MNFIVDNNNLNDFNRKMKTGNMIVWYFAPWCGHCKMMEPEWNKFMSFKNSHPVLSKSLNCARVSDSILPHLHDKYRSISGFPTIKFYKNGNQTPHGEFESHMPRTSENFKEFTLNNLNTDSLSSNTDSVESSESVEQPMRKKRRLGSKKKRGSKKGKGSRRRRSRGRRSRRR